VATTNSDKLFLVDRDQFNDFLDWWIRYFFSSRQRSNVILAHLSGIPVSWSAPKRRHRNSHLGVDACHPIDCICMGGSRSDSDRTNGDLVAVQM
jgi:hypothetical protein